MVVFGNARFFSNCVQKLCTYLHYVKLYKVNSSCKVFKHKGRGIHSHNFRNKSVQCTWKFDLTQNGSFLRILLGGVVSSGKCDIWFFFWCDLCFPWHIVFMSLSGTTFNFYLLWHFHLHCCHLVTVYSCTAKKPTLWPTLCMLTTTIRLLSFPSVWLDVS